MMDLVVNRALTTAFIGFLPVELVLTPHLKVKKPTGGWVLEAQAPRAPQTFTLIEPPAEPRPTVTADGIERVIVFELLGEWDAQISRFDTFPHQGKEFELVELYYDNGYERRAMVAARG